MLDAHTATLGSESKTKLGYVFRSQATLKAIEMKPSLKHLYNVLCSCALEMVAEMEPSLLVYSHNVRVACYLKQISPNQLEYPKSQ